MKVIKRDGRTIEFDREKIEVAIEKANKEVRGKEKATKDEIQTHDRKRFRICSGARMRA